MKLEGKTAIVTGGTKGIGRAIAEAFLKEGMKVFISARDKVEVKHALEELSTLGRVSGTWCDVRDDGRVGVMFKECVEEFGGVDVLINNAGIGKFGRVEEMEPQDFRAVLETNLFGVFYCCHEAIPLMKQAGGGYIINISSLAGTNAHPEMAAYNASKFGLNGFSEALMQEVREDGIKVSYIMPGSVNTYFNDKKPSPDKRWQLQAEDIARVCVDLLHHDERSLPSRVEIRPSKPPKKN
jgi:NAD(P)-dependent dehydrogenase (short-subunit alcohol dehydrogenase family)